MEPENEVKEAMLAASWDEREHGSFLAALSGAAAPTRHMLDQTAALL